MEIYEGELLTQPPPPPPMPVTEGRREYSASMAEKRAFLESKLKEIRSPEIIERMRKISKLKEKRSSDNIIVKLSRTATPLASTPHIHHNPRSVENDSEGNLSEHLSRLSHKIDSFENLLTTNLGKPSLSSEVYTLKKEMDVMKKHMEELKERTNILARIISSSSTSTSTSIGTLASVPRRRHHTSSKKEIKSRDNRHYMEKYHLDKRYLGKHQLDTILFI